jgi:hypothetical protein
MPVVIGVAILMVLLWAGKRSRASRINITQQRLSGAIALAVALGFLDFISWARRCLGR